ncbi:MAG: HPt (histidine-containing phosphotransfer) domain-containing protein [Flavobacterium sp.]|jgi:HPt (histidine-containing phosphotransfer) domain-containing protein
MAARSLMAFSDHLDKATFEELKEIMEEDFEVLLETYLLDSNSKLAALQEAFKQKDLAAIREISHGFKGSSLNIGAQALASLCAGIEDLSRESKFAEALVLLQQVIAEYESVKVLIEEKT